MIHTRLASGLPYNGGLTFSDSRIGRIAASRRCRKAAAAAFVAGYFLFFTADGLLAHWAPDDMMNMAGYFERGGWRALYSQVLIASDAYRPAGALFYLPLYTLFGLNPFPFRAVVFLLLAVNVVLFYRVARLLGAEELVAGAAALVMSYHAGLAELYYRTSAVYDVLACFFYLSAMLYYLRVRASGRFLGVGEMVTLLLLFLGALNSKEIAATLPLLLVAYECIYHPPETGSREKLRSWLWRDNRILPILAAIDALYVFGRTHGPGALTKIEAYRPVFTLRRAIEFHQNALAELFYQADPLSRGALLAVAVVVTYAAWRTMKRDLRFYWFWILITPLPIEFLPGRTSFCLYVPLVGWSLLGAAVFVGSARGISEWLSREPLFTRVRKPVICGALIAFGAGAYVWATAVQKRTEAAPRLARHGSRTWSIIQQLRAIGLKPRAGDRILFIGDPYEGWDMLFIAQLTFHQPGMRIWLMNKSPKSPPEVAEMDHVLAFQGDTLRLIR